MKKLFYTLLLVLASSALQAQTHLRISSISGIPQDSVFEIASYDSIYVTVVNDDTAAFSDFIDIFMKSHNNQFPDSLIQNSLVNIASGDSASLNRQGYTFSPQYFSEGDNIVVVWPNARNASIVADSLTFSVYFVSLIASVPENPDETFILYPNPSTRYISFKGTKEIEVKYVRIFDVTGKEIYHNQSIERMIPTMDWKAGLYIIQIEKSDGTNKIFKIQKAD